MGLFSFLKKKKSKPVIVKVTMSDSKATTYDPWENKTMPRNDDYAVAAFISMSEKGAKIGKSNDDYPRYFSYDYSVNNPIEYHKRVIADGYLTEAEPSLPLRYMKVAELKEILDKNNLQSKGKKDELIKRIAENIDVSSLGLDTYYVPTEKGMEHLKKYEYVFRLHKYGISWEQYDDFKNKISSYAKPNDVIWHLLNERFNSYNTSGDFGLARNELYHMGIFLEAENRHLDALYHFILVLYYDTSGCGNHYTGSPENVFIAPGIAENICKLKDYYEPMLIEKCYKNYSLPHHCISKKNFQRLVGDILEDRPLDAKNYL